MDVIEICRCCLTNNDPFLTIYEGGATSEYCLAAMLKKITGLQVFIKVQIKMFHYIL